MMQTRPFIPKLIKDMPDFWTVNIHFLDGTNFEWKIVRSYVDDKGIYSILTHDDEWKWYPVSSIKGVESCKNFSKIKALEEKEKQRLQDEAKQNVEKQKGVA